MSVCLVSGNSGCSSRALARGKQPWMELESGSVIMLDEARVCFRCSKCIFQVILSACLSNTVHCGHSLHKLSRIGSMK